MVIGPEALEPSEMFTVGGTLTPGSLLAKLIVTPPLGAASFNATTPELEVPPINDTGVSVIAASKACGTRVFMSVVDPKIAET